ncbi:hypothetical protein K501DRAFT_203429, partial [Backusella circina FSU 941]
MPPSINNSKRKTILPLHIDTTSFTNQQSNGASKYNALPPPPLSDKSSRAIVVAGHAIYRGPLIVSELSSDANWVLEPFQKGGQVNTFVQHIQKGIDILKDDPDAVLIFSGGETRPSAGPRSEAVSYWNIAQLLIKEHY